MKRSTITTVLLVIVLGGLVASTGYAFNLMTSYKDKLATQSNANEKLVADNKKMADASKKNADELEKQKKAIADLEKKNQELTANNTTVDQDRQVSPVNQTVSQQPITDYQSEEDKQFIEQKSAENKERIAQEEAKANEPVYAIYDGEMHPVRFMANNQIEQDSFLTLNGLSNVNELVGGQSYRVK